MDVNRLFRKKSLERLNSPEELDMLVKQVPTKGWLLVWMFTIIIISVIVWGFLGSIATKVKASGIIMNSGGVVSVYSDFPGVVKKVLVKNSDVIQKGDVIALMAQPDIEAEIALKEEQLSELQNKYSSSKQDIQRDMELSTKIKNDDQIRINDNIKYMKQELQELTAQLQKKQELYKEGLVRKYDVDIAQNNIDTVNLKIKTAQNELASNNLTVLQKKQSSQSNLRSDKDQIDNLTLSLNVLKEKYKKASEIKADQSGKVIEVDISVGDVIAAGSSIAEVEKMGEEGSLQVVFFTSALKGKSIQEGFGANIDPTIVKKEEFGFMRAKVDFVSQFPASRKSVENILNNDALTSSFMQEGPPIVVYASLIKDKSTYSGFKWSSVKGPNIHITSGTMCDVEVTVREQAPITLVIPYIKKTLGIE